MGGEVYFDINGKNIGRLAMTDCNVDLPAGTYHIRMYKSHSYGGMIGFADATVQVQEEESLLIRYSTPATVNQPGHIMVCAYSPEAANAAAQEAAYRISAAKAEEQRKEEQRSKGTKTAITWIIVGTVVSVLSIAIIYGVIWSSIF